jgi:hypothetical protein
MISFRIAESEANLSSYLCRHRLSREWNAAERLTAASVGNRAPAARRRSEREALFPLRATTTAADSKRAMREQL